MVLGNLILSGFPRTMDVQNRDHRSPGKAGGNAHGLLAFFFWWVLFSWMRGEWARQDGDVMSGLPQLANFYCASVTIMMKLN